MFVTHCLVELSQIVKDELIRQLFQRRNHSKQKYRVFYYENQEEDDARRSRLLKRGFALSHERSSSSSSVSSRSFNAEGTFVLLWSVVPWPLPLLQRSSFFFFCGLYIFDAQRWRISMTIYVRGCVCPSVYCRNRTKPLDDSIPITF